MTTIRTTCPRCGEVDMGPDAIRLSVADDDGAGIYRFICPVCREDVEKQADRKIVALLVSAGVALAGADGAMPTHGEEEARTEGAPFTLDDVIAFHYELEDEDALRRFLEG